MNIVQVMSFQVIPMTYMSKCFNVLKVYIIIKVSIICFDKHASFMTTKVYSWFALRYCDLSKIILLIVTSIMYVCSLMYGALLFLCIIGECIRGLNPLFPWVEVLFMTSSTSLVKVNFVIILMNFFNVP